VLPDWLLRVMALFIPVLRQITPELGVKKKATHGKARKVLDWTPRSNQESILATAESLVRLGLLQGAK
jgi:dihydroflavonol-4-reductase